MSAHAWQYSSITFTRKDWKVIFPSTETVWDALDRVGADGWEMVQCLPDVDAERSVIVLKKRIKAKHS